MNKKIGILNYGQIGNVYSINKSISLIKESHEEVLIVNSSNDLGKIDKLIIPGVGNFYYLLKELTDLKEKIILFSKKKWTLGICVGMQILCESGEEVMHTDGFGIFNGHVGQLETKIKPNIGFHTVFTEKKDASIWCDMPNKNLFYFMHSFAVKNSNHATTSTMTPCNFVASMQKEYAIGVQFHPEKSRDTGLVFLKKFLQLK